jgi:F-type H+-transporting ATPase subunit b
VVLLVYRIGPGSQRLIPKNPIVRISRRCAAIDPRLVDTLANPLLKLGVLELSHSIRTIVLAEQSSCVRQLATGLSKRPRPTPFMDQILNQLGGLVLGSVPTIVLFILLVTAYGLLVRRPLDRVLAERRARTSGAEESARSAISAAEAETAAYEAKLRAAKAEIFQAREQKLKQWNAERDATLAQVRQVTQERIRGARHEIEQSAQEARLHIVSVSDELSSRILTAVLPSVVRQTEVAQ